MPSLSDKHQLRSLMKKMRKEHSPLERRKKSEIICGKLVEGKEFQQAKIILLYYPKDDEVDTKAAIVAALEKKKVVCLPCTDRKTGTITACAISGLDGRKDLEKAAFGIPEPKKDGRKTVAPKKIDVIVVPGIAFDLHGDRVGHGLGYYDKFLAAAKGASKIAIAFDFQVVDEKIVCDSHDARVDEIITEKRHIVVRK